MKIQHFGHVDNGILKIHYRAVFDSLLSNFNGKDVEVIVQRKRKKRSNNQNRYYWGVIIPCIQQGLFDTQGEWLNNEQVHEFLKQNFNYKEIVNQNNGEMIKLGLTTTDKTTIEFEEYQDKCRQFADEFLNIIIPLPNEQSEINY